MAERRPAALRLCLYRKQVTQKAVAAESVACTHRPYVQRSAFLRQFQASSLGSLSPPWSLSVEGTLCCGVHCTVHRSFCKLNVETWFERSEKSVNG